MKVELLKPAERIRRGGGMDACPSVSARCRPGRWAIYTAVALVLSLTVLAVGAGGAAAQDSSTLVGNTGQTSSGNARWSDRDHSQAFTTGAESSGYNITEVAFEIAIHNSGGTTEPTFEVRIQAADAQGRPTGDSLGMFVRSDPLTAGVNTFSVEGSPIHLDPNTQYVLVFDFVTPGNRDVRIALTMSDDTDAGGAPSWSAADESLSRVGNAGFGTLDSQSLKFTIGGYAGAAVRSVYDELEDYFSGQGTLRQVEEALRASGKSYYEKLSEEVAAGRVHKRFDPGARSVVGTDGTSGWHQVGTPSIHPGPSDTCGGKTVPGGGLREADRYQFYWNCTQDGQWVPVKTPQPGVDYADDEDLLRPGQQGYNDDCRHRDEDGNPATTGRFVVTGYRVVRTYVWTDDSGETITEEIREPVGHFIESSGNSWDPIAEQCTTRGNP